MIYKLFERNKPTWDIGRAREKLVNHEPEARIESVKRAREKLLNLRAGDQ